MGTCPEAIVVEETVWEKIDPTANMADESFAQFCQTYGPHEQKESTMYHDNNNSTTTTNNNKSETDMITSAISSEDSSSFWNHLLSSYLPIILLWVKSSMFGTANMLRSLILGNFLLFVLHQFNPPESVRECAWWNTLCAALGANSKADPQAWPPPALSLLAVLTVVALIIHPDGFTWIIWRTIRECIVESLRTLVFCWNVMVHDYGIIPTIVASATFATLLFLGLIVHKTLSPRIERDDNPRNERKKKKRRNHHHTRTGGNRIRGGNQSQKSKPSEETAKLDIAASLQTPASNRPTPLLPDPSTPLLQERDSNISNEQAASSLKHPQLLPRHRLPSASTIDTTTLTDDQSCESVQSSPLAHVTISSGSSFDPPTATENTAEESAPIVQSKTSRWSQLHSSTDREHNVVQNNRSRGKKWSKDMKLTSPAGKPPSEPWDFHRPNRRTGSGRRGSGNQNVQTPRNNNNRTGRCNSFHPTASSTFPHEDAPDSQQRNLLPPRSPEYVSHQYANHQFTSILLGVESPTGPRVTNPTIVSNPNNGYSNYETAPRPMIRPPPGLTRDTGIDQVPLVSYPSPFLTSPPPPPPPPASWLPRHDEGLFPSNTTFPGASLEATATSFYPASSQSSSLNNSFSCSTPLVKENPFEDNDDEMESRIEAELQELGGQMAGSILDF